MTVDGLDSITRGKVSKRRQSAGSKVHRGFTVCASGTPSIPSRYLTIISSNSEKPGFHQTSKRFQYDFNVTPGPGQYQTVQPLTKQLEKTSDSKKGTGTFASKSKREDFMNNLIDVPAPTSYNITSIFGSGHHDFNRSKYSSMFQKPIAERPISPKASLPAPNLYDINQALRTITRSNNVTAEAAFRSHTKRSIASNQNFMTPAPGTYNLDDSAIRSLPPIYQSIFKSTSKRDTFNVESARGLPGPADYRPFEKLIAKPQRQLFPRHHYLTISAPAAPQPPQAPFPGPGAYELRDFKDAEKKFMSSAAFISSTSRWAIDTRTTTAQPGPGSYTPHSPTKQSFNFNFERRWLS